MGEIYASYRYAWMEFRVIWPVNVVVREQCYSLEDKHSEKFTTIFEQVNLSPCRNMAWR